jgi:hypothetical protein
MNKKEFGEFVTGFCEEVEINFTQRQCTRGAGQYALHTLARMCEVSLEDFTAVKIIEGFMKKLTKSERGTA